MYVHRSLATMGGVERVLIDKMNWLARNGCDVTLVTNSQGQHPMAFPLDERVRHLDTDTRFFLLYKHSPLVRLWKHWQLLKRYRQRLQEIVDDLQPDVIITTTYQISTCGVILDLKTAAKRIAESHCAKFATNIENKWHRIPVLRWLVAIQDRYYSRRVGKFDKLVVLTQGDAAEWRPYAPHIAVIPNPVTRRPETIPQRDGSGRRIICVGRLASQKGFDRLIDAFALIADQCPEWSIDIFGNGPDREMLLSRIVAKHLEGRIRINAATPRIFDEYQQSEFYVMSSRYEGLPLVLIEAMSCGLPCVSFRCRYGAEDLITEGETGLLVPYGDIQALADRILWMAEHTDERLRMGRNARQSSAQYTQDSIMPMWLKLFEEE